MRSIALVMLAVASCNNDQPPPIGDSDATPPKYFADAYTPPQPEDAGDAGTVLDLDFDGTCVASGDVPVWHFFDFQTHTPSNSSLSFSARTADTEALLASAEAVTLATVTGADITTWTGVDVAAKLTNGGLVSRAFLRIIIVETPATDGTMPVLVNYRQAYDCVVGQ